MKSKDGIKKSYVVYSVDPERLLIEGITIMQVENGAEHTTTYENFVFEKNHTPIQLSLDDLPIKIRGMFYFKTKEDARDFVKRQIGM